MTRVFWWIVLVTVLGSCFALVARGDEMKKAASSPAQPANTKQLELPLASVTEFSATMVGGLLGNIDELKVYRSGNLMRTEMLDGKNYMVTDLEKRETWVVLPDRCAHDPRPSINTFPFSTFQPGQNIQRTLAGTEKIEGHACQVEEVTITSRTGSSMKLKMWEAVDLSGFPIKLEIYRAAGSPTTITYKDVKIGKPNPGLFKHLADCSPPESTSDKRKNGE